MGASSGCYPSDCKYKSCYSDFIKDTAICGNKYADTCVVGTPEECKAKPPPGFTADNCFDPANQYFVYEMYLD
jgi:hypothetical protein